MQWRLLNVGMKASAEEIVRALESVRVRRVVGMGKGKGLLFNCTGSAEVAATLKDRSGKPMSLTDLCDRIIRVCELEPQSALESEGSQRRRLKIKLPLIVKISFRIFQHHKGTLENAILRGI